MKTASLLLCGLLLSATTIENASAEVVRVRLTARVTQVDDPSGVLGGVIVPGRRVTGLYTYNTNTPPVGAPGGGNQYRLYAGEARMRFVSGGLVFESRPLAPGITIFVSPQGPVGIGQFVMASPDNQPLANGASIFSIRVDFQGSGNLTMSNALPAVIPNLANYYPREIVFDGGSATTSALYQVRAMIEVAEPVATPTIDVSPAAGEFLPQQQFDAAVLLPAGKTAASMHASAGGFPLYQFDYPGACQIAPPNSSNRQALHCPYANTALGNAPVGAPIDVSVTLTDGTVLTQSVEWTLLQ